MTTVEEAAGTGTSQDGRPRYTMTISRMTVDKLGVKLYDRISAVLAELIANAYDADAEHVTVRAPMDQYLSVVRDGQLVDLGLMVEVVDDGHGMTPEEVNRFYLRVGAERRNDPKRGDRSREFKRRVMGRKGVGKLAPFGVCEQIEVLTAGGDLVTELDADGNEVTGYVTAHLFLDRGDILSDEDSQYHPVPGSRDGQLSPSRGTTLRLTRFDRRRVPDIHDLARQLAQRFGVTGTNWEVVLEDTSANLGTKDSSVVVGEFDVPTMVETGLRFLPSKEVAGQVVEHVVVDATGNVVADLRAGFEHEGRFLPVTGWAAYSEKPYKDDLMAGVRVYCRGKIAAQTALFGLRAGFTGEHDVRSYLVGEVHADWLDEAEDLIQTDRRDILWSHELGQAFEEWGQAVVRRIARASRNPMKKKTWEQFMEVGDVRQRIGAAFPGNDLAPIRSAALEMARLMGQSLRGDQVDDVETVDSLVSVALSLAPHVTLDEQLRLAAEAANSPLQVVTAILRTAKVAELSSFGRIADERLRVIKNLERLKDDPATTERELQMLIDGAPWLIDPQWSPIVANQSFNTLRKEFEKYYELHEGEAISLSDFTDPAKRADFVLTSQDGMVQIIEIKRPGHSFENEEMDRFNRYYAMMVGFLREPANRDFTKHFHGVRLTLVCDHLALTNVHKTAFDQLCKSEEVVHLNWTSFLLRTTRAHQDFLNEAERQRRVAGLGPIVP